MTNLSGQLAIVTGGAQGIGLETVRTFAKAGADVVIWDVNSAHGESAVTSLTELGVKAYFQHVNVADNSAVHQAVKYITEQWGIPKILVNNAGITRDSRLTKMSPEDWNAVLNVNLTGVFNCVQAVSPYMTEAQYGRIISASSVVAKYGNFGQTNYVAAKAGVVGMTKVWARELGKYGITVNAVAPGFIATDMIATVPQKVLDGFIEKTPVRRLGTATDIAQAYLFLASPEASFITGTVLEVDGGLTL